jgi:beta-aspartyl-peptidase (threonine type)
MSLATPQFVELFTQRVSKGCKMLHRVGFPAVLFAFLAVGARMPAAPPAVASDDTKPAVVPKQEYRLLIHGGARSAPASEMTAGQDAAYRAALTEALRVGEKILKDGGSSLDAVEATIVSLEESPLFNAGRGAVFTSAGTHELDASIMDGETKAAGAVASVKVVRNPIRLARLVMQKTPHVLLVGQGAEELARQESLEIVPNEFFSTDEKRAEWNKVRNNVRRDDGNKDQKKDGNKNGNRDGNKDAPRKSSSGKMGTVGCVALDRSGRLAAGTSTGGLTNKRFGRVGDSPIIGAGTYADNKTCAVSCTGTGEYFIRTNAAHEVSALMRLKGLGVQAAVSRVIHEEIGPLGGDGGIIAMDSNGVIAADFNTAGLFRGWIGSDGEPHVQTFEKPDL